MHGGHSKECGRLRQTGLTGRRVRRRERPVGEGLNRRGPDLKVGAEYSVTVRKIFSRGAASGYARSMTDN
jgi:hypothetical protein